MKQELEIVATCREEEICARGKLEIEITYEAERAWQVPFLVYAVLSVGGIFC